MTFLWSGQHFALKVGLIVWENLCTTKSARGLGLGNILPWNIASLGKYIWAITSKHNSVWIKWVIYVYLKEKNWWQYVPNTGASWYWKRICNVKE